MTAQMLLEAAVGPFGLLVVLLLFLLAVGSGKFYVPRGAYDREVERVDKLDAQVDASTELLRKIISNQELADARAQAKREASP